MPSNIQMQKAENLLSTLPKLLPASDLKRWTDRQAQSICIINRQRYCPV